MKNVVMLSPHFPTNYRSFVSALRNYGANALGIGDEPYNRLHPKLKDNLTEYFKVENMHNYDELQKACGFFTWKYGKIDRLESHNEYWLNTEAALRDDFNITGLRVEDMKFIKCKSEMKQIYKSIGLKVAEGKVVHTIEDAKAIISTTGYPVVLKPDAGVGAAATYKIKTDEQLADFFNTKPADVTYILEEFITGQIHSFDGLADSESNPVFFTSHIFNQGIMDVVNKDIDVWYYSDRDIPKKFEKIGRDCVKAFKVKDRFFHLEFFYTPKGEYIPLEVNIRPPGGLSIDMFNYACDIDIFGTWADLILNGKNYLDYERKFHCLYIGRKNGKSYANPHSEILKTYADCICVHQEMPQVFRNALGDYAYVLRAAKLDKIMEMVQYIHKTN